MRIGIITKNSIFQILPDAHSCPASLEGVDPLSYNFPCIVSLLRRANQFCFNRIRAKPSSHWSNVYTLELGWSRPRTFYRNCSSSSSKQQWDICQVLRVSTQTQSLEKSWESQELTLPCSTDEGSSSGTSGLVSLSSREHPPYTFLLIVIRALTSTFQEGQVFEKWQFFAIASAHCYPVLFLSSITCPLATFMCAQLLAYLIS